ncbi:hypothetical protein SOHN41_03128 [Shewanella sp. HN-41]|nr:hypothetical protein SOHN41_03128 [Shewanella sp. HN-41]
MSVAFLSQFSSSKQMHNKVQQPSFGNYHLFCLCKNDACYPGGRV